MVPSSDILKRLEPAVRPIEGEVPRRSGGVEHRSFGELIAESTANGPVSASMLKIADGIELTSDQRSALARAANQAMSASADRVMVLMDGRAIVLDVAGQAVESEFNMADLDANRAMTPVQGVITATTGAGEAAAANQRMLDQLRSPAVAARVLGH